MSSKRSGRKGGKGKKTNVSPAKPSATVTDLFKKQLRTQANKIESEADTVHEKSDYSSMAIEEEETASPYFSPKKSQTGCLHSEVNDGGDCVRYGAKVSSLESQSRDQQIFPATEVRLSRKLSLRKRSHADRNIGEAAVSSDCSRSPEIVSQEDRLTFSKQDFKRAKSVQSSAGEKTDVTDKHDKKPSSTERQLTVTGLEFDKTNLNDDMFKTKSSHKSKLSLNRKRNSQDMYAASPHSHSSKVQCTDSPCTDFEGQTSVENSMMTPTSAFSLPEQPSITHSFLSSAVDRRLGHAFSSPGIQMVSNSVESRPTVASSSKEKPETSPRQRPLSILASSGKEFANEEHNGEEDGLQIAAENAEEDKEGRVSHVPYYLENFKTIMKLVFSDDHNIQLFNEADLEYASSFNNLSESSQKLYVRLFSRKLAWLSSSKIKYPEISDDLSPFLEELVKTGLLCSGEQLEDLPVVLGAMTAPHLRTLAKSYHVNPSGQQKGHIIQTLVTKSQQSTVASLFGQKIGAVKAAMLKRAKKMLGPVYQLYKDCRTVFMRAMMLFSLINTNGDEESGNGGQRQLFQMLMVNIGRVVYPAYKVSRQTQIFNSREDLIRFEEALQLESELLNDVSSGNWKGAYSVYLTVKERYDQLLKNSTVADWDGHVPDFLRSYSACSVLVRLLSQGIEILQRRKDYTAAVSLIRELLGQNMYHQVLRGYWWDRLALNLDVHLKQQAQALQVIEEGLADPLVQLGHRLSLYLRAEGICTKPKSSFSKRLKDFSHEPLLELPKAYVEGRVLSHSLPGCRYQFITDRSYTEGNDREVTMCNVEQIVLDYYSVNGFPYGIHGEGSVVSILFCLYFWDILFMDVPDAFHSPYQTAPLDFQSDAFYLRRQTAILERLNSIENGTEEELHAMLADTWEKQQGVMCAGMNWERFSSIDEIQALVTCMGGKVLSGILGRYAQQPRRTRGGFPDLTLWNTVTRQLKISEVKGPGDRLSHKQMLWLDHLLKLGVDAEVCHVIPVGVKKLKPVTKQGT